MFKCVIGKQYKLVEQVVSTVKKPNQSPWQNAVVWYVEATANVKLNTIHI